MDKNEAARLFAYTRWANARFTEALEKLHVDPSLRLALGREGRAKVLSEFDLHTNAGLLAQRFRAGGPP